MADEKKKDKVEKKDIAEKKPAKSKKFDKPKPEGIKVKVEKFASLTYQGKKYKRGDVLYVDDAHYKKWERWLKKV